MKLAALLLFTVTVAAADTPHEQADTLYKLGRDQLAAGKLTEACESFAKSDAAEPAATTLLALGVCREKLGQLATAWQIYQEVGKRLQGTADPTSQQLAKVAAANLARVEPRLSHLTIAVTGGQPPGLEVRRGEGIVPIDSYGKPVALDGGTYAISVRAPGREPWTSTITLGAEKDNQTVHVPVLPMQSVAGGPARPVVGAGGPSIEPAPHRSRALPIGIGVGAVVLGAVAIGLEVSARSTYDDAKREPDDGKQLDLWHGANHKRYAAEGFGIAGVAAAGVAVFLLVRGGGGDDEQPRVSVAPMVTGDQLGFAIGGRY